MGTGTSRDLTVTVKIRIEDDYASREDFRWTVFQSELKQLCDKYDSYAEIDVKEE
jgi:hypothetical protein